MAIAKTIHRMQMTPQSPGGAGGRGGCGSGENVQAQPGEDVSSKGGPKPGGVDNGTGGVAGRDASPLANNNGTQPVSNADGSDDFSGGGGGGSSNMVRQLKHGFIHWREFEYFRLISSR